MTIQNAVKKLSRFAEVQTDGHGTYWAIKNGQRVSFLQNGDGPNATCFHSQRASEQADSQTDYFPGMYWRNLTQAIANAEAS